MIKELMKSIREYKRDSILTPILVSLEVVMECIIPFVVAQLVNEIKAGSGMGVISRYGLILVVMALMSLAFGAGAGSVCASASCGFAKNLRKDMFYRIQDFSFENIDKFSTSSLVTRMTTDVMNVQLAFMMLIRLAIRSPLMLIFSFTMAFIMGGKMALIFLVVIPILGIGLFAVIHKVGPLFKRVFRKYDALNNSIQENVKGMRVVKSFVREEYEKEKFHHAAEEVCQDFTRAEIEMVPAYKAVDIGLDRSMIGAYGQDDRICAYTAMMAEIQAKTPEYTTVTALVDKEEIGSVGATGMHSRFFENAVAELMNLTGEYSELNVRRCLSRSCMLSSDVSAGFDPSYRSCFELRNAAWLGAGMVFNKFTGSRGKSGSNDANAEYMAHLRKIMDEKEITYQTAELGKVDVGGGGTIAYILALYGMNVIDSGVPVLNMHAPWEATSKADIYEAYKGYMAFAEGAAL